MSPCVRGTTGGAQTSSQFYQFRSECELMSDYLENKNLPPTLLFSHGGDSRIAPTIYRPSHQSSSYTGGQAQRERGLCGPILSAFTILLAMPLCTFATLPLYSEFCILTGNPSLPPLRKGRSSQNSAFSPFTISSRSSPSSNSIVYRPSGGLSKSTSPDRLRSPWAARANPARRRSDRSGESTSAGPENRSRPKS